MHADPSLLGEGLGQPLQSSNEPEVVERLRPQLDGEPADVLQGPDNELPQLEHGLTEVLAVVRLLDRLQPEQNRRQRLTCLVMQLAGKTLALELLTCHDTT